jgi:flagellar biosynthetic protein FlhB
MGEAATSDDKIHPPTPRKRQRAKEQGRGPRSAELVTSASLLVATLVLRWTGPSLADGLIEGLEESLRRGEIRMEDSRQLYQHLVSAAVGVGALLLPTLVALMLGGLAAQMMQSGLRMVPDRLLPSPDRLSPMARLGGLLRWRSLGGLAICVLKLVVLAAVFGFFFQQTLPQLLRLPGAPLHAIGPTLFAALTECCLWSAATMVLFAGVDYALAWWRFERDLMMTEQELREELRDLQRSSTPPTTSRSQPVQAVA